MAVLEIKNYKEPVLRKKSEEVKEVNEGIRGLVNDMAETMEKNNGIGLAAPQVGISKRIIAAKPDFKKPGVFSLINPRILKISKEKEIAEEGCLSFYGIFLKIKRAKEVEVGGLDAKGKEIKVKADGLFARILQHEIDHLDGILFFDRLNFFGRIKFRLKMLKKWN